jgi:hypothetical protein
MEGALKEIQEARKESYNKFNPFLINAERDQKVVLGDQYEEKDKEKLNKKGRAILNINIVGKGCRMISAQQRQNPMDLVAYPIEGSDSEGADVYTKVHKWLFSNGEYKMARSLAFDDTIDTGIGWLAPEMCYDYDPLFGDIKLNHESIYSILPDPYMTSMLLDDCDWIIRQKYLSKEKCKNLWSDYEKEIDDLDGGTANEIAKPLKTDKNKLLVCEKWYRSYEKVMIVFDLTTLQSQIWDKDEIEFKALKAVDPRFQNLELVKKQVPVMKLQIGINDQLLIHDGDVPEGYSSTKYPFIPIWGFYKPHFNEENWNMKLHGYARMLIDSQREKNKTRSILMDGLKRSLRGRFFMEKGTFENPQDIASERDVPLVVKSGMWDKWKEGVYPQIDMAMVQLEQMHTQDAREQGLNPDLLQVEGGSAASAPTSSLQLRREQGMMSVQQLFDNLGLANRMLGLYNTDLINMWPVQKIEKIIGQPLPKDWEQRKENTRYDYVVDENSSSPTYRHSVYNQVLNLAQHGGIQVPPQIMRDIIVDFPADLKRKWDQIDQQNQQQAQQAQQQQTEIQKSMMQIQMQVEQLKQQGETMRQQMADKAEMDRLMKKLINDLAIANKKTASGQSSKIKK